MARCFLLGAGFSRAISAQMPLMRDLGPAVLSDLRLPGALLDRFSGDLESWLNYLASPPPWVSDSDALDNRKLFHDASRSIGRILLSAEQSVIAAAPPPDWLRRIASEWAFRQSPVLTFNYDTLVERALNYHNISYPLARLYPIPTTARYQGPARRRIAVQKWPQPRIYKLHGSLNLYYGGLDSGPFDPVTINPPSFPAWSAGLPYLPADDHVFDDLVPLIVPPTSTKGAFYNNKALRALWRNAAREIRDANEVVLIGYSLPVTDSSVAQFIRLNLQVGARVVVVDPSDATCARISAALAPHVVTTFRGPDALADFVASTCGELVTCKWDGGRTVLETGSSAGTDLSSVVGAHDSDWASRVTSHLVRVFGGNVGIMHGVKDGEVRSYLPSGSDPSDPYPKMLEFR